MNKQRTNRASTIMNDPFASVIPMPEGHAGRAPDATTAERPPNEIEAPTGHRQKLTVHLEADLTNRVKNAAYWNPRLTIAKIAAAGIRMALEEVERENGGRYPQRESELVGGRPMK